MSADEKAAGVLHAPATATQNKHFDSKRFATLRARAALAGVILCQTTNDKDEIIYIASRWALTKPLESLDALEKWLNAVSGVRHG